MKILKLFIIAILFSSCNNFSKNENVFDSDKLIGKYKVDITPFINEVTKTEEKEDDTDKFAKGLATLMLSSVEIEFNFYEDNKGIISLDGSLVNFASAFGDGDIEKVKQFEYKVVNDSILYMKADDMKEFNKWAIVRKFSKNYDYLQFLIVEEGKEKVFFNLKKITE